MSGTGNTTTRYAPWTRPLPRKLNYKSDEVSLVRLKDEIWAYVDYMTPTPEEEIVNRLVQNHVQRYLEAFFPGCRIRILGSTSTGLRLPRSDIDLVVETDDEVSVGDELAELAYFVREKGWVKEVDEILNARVPIIKISTLSEFGSLSFDVAINNISGLRNNEWVKRQLNTILALKPLAMIIRGALWICGLNDASQHGLSSFAVYNPYELPESHLEYPRRKRSMVESLKGFLMYFSKDVPFERWYISPSRGILVKKPKKGNRKSVHQRCYEKLVIQCPTDPERIITASLLVEKFERIQLMFGGALEKIWNAEKTNQSVSGSLVSVGQKFMEYRGQIKQLVGSGQLVRNLQFYESELESEESEN